MQPRGLGERLVRPVRFERLQITPLEITASAFTVGLLVWLHTMGAPSGTPLLVPSFAASIGVMFTEPDMASSRTWNVIVGQMLGAVSGLIAGTLCGSISWLAAALAMALALAAMQLTRSVHPPGLATALIVAVTTPDHTLRFLVFPVLAGVLIIVIVARLVQALEREMRSRFSERPMEP